MELVNTEGNVNVKTESVRGIRESLFFVQQEMPAWEFFFLVRWALGTKRQKQGKE